MPLTRVNNAGLAFDGGAFGFRNLLINANPIINQRGYVSGTATAGANEYTLDRWRVVTSGQSLVFSNSNGIVTCTAPAGGVEQVIEGANNFGGIHTLSWGGTATATVNGTSVSKNGQINLASGTDVTVKFSGGTFALPQLELGTTVTFPDFRPIGIELMLCQRYYWRMSGTEYYGAGYFQSTTDWNGCVVRWPVTMRIAPAVSFAAASNYTFGLGGGSITAATIAASNITTRSANIYGTVASGGTLNAGSVLVSGANGFLAASAEF